MLHRMDVRATFLHEPIYEAQVYLIVINVMVAYVAMHMLRSFEAQWMTFRPKTPIRRAGSKIDQASICERPFPTTKTKTDVRNTHTLVLALDWSTQLHKTTLATLVRHLMIN